jgi:hypothetical protein
MGAFPEALLKKRHDLDALKARREQLGYIVSAFGTVFTLVSS